MAVELSRWSDSMVHAASNRFAAQHLPHLDCGVRGADRTEHLHAGCMDIHTGTPAHS